MAHRVYVAIPIADAAPLLERGPEQSDDGWIDLRGIKVFIDGTLGSRGAALLEPYADANHRGFMNRTTKEVLMPVFMWHGTVPFESSQSRITVAFDIVPHK
jgi:predicted amidohydrolase YtcJ